MTMLGDEVMVQKRVLVSSYNNLLTAYLWDEKWDEKMPQKFAVRKECTLPGLRVREKV